MKNRKGFIAVICIGIVIVLLFLAYQVMTGGEEQEDTQTRERYEYDTQELYAKRDGNRIYGEIYIPQRAGAKMPAVIFSHGFGGTHQAGEQYARPLC